MGANHNTASTSIGISPNSYRPCCMIKIPIISKSCFLSTMSGDNRCIISNANLSRGIITIPCDFSILSIDYIWAIINRYFPILLNS